MTPADANGLEMIRIWSRAKALWGCCRTMISHRVFEANWKRWLHMCHQPHVDVPISGGQSFDYAFRAQFFWQETHSCGIVICSGKPGPARRWCRRPPE